MRRGLINKHITTAHIFVHTNLCVDCGKCAEACPKGVLDRVSAFVHKHVHVSRPDLCVGCLKCVKVCKQHAIIPKVVGGKGAGQAPIRAPGAVSHETSAD